MAPANFNDELFETNEYSNIPKDVRITTLKPPRIFLKIKNLGWGQQGDAFLCVPFDAIPPTEITDRELALLKKQLRVVKVFRDADDARNKHEIEAMKTHAMLTSKHTARLTSHALNYTWSAQTFSGPSIEKLLTDKAQRQWYGRPSFCWEILRQGLKALVHLHAGVGADRATAHYDLVPSNVCLRLVQNGATSKPQVRLSLIDFGRATTFPKDVRLLRCKQPRSDVANLAAIVHSLYHPYHYDRALSQSEGNYLPILNEEDDACCQCKLKMEMHDFTGMERHRYGAFEDKDLTLFLDELAKPFGSQQPTAVEALRLLDTKYQSKFQYGYTIPPQIVQLLERAMPSDEKIIQVIDKARHEGKIPQAFSTTRSRRKAVKTRQTIKSRPLKEYHRVHKLHRGEYGDNDTGNWKRHSYSTGRIVSLRQRERGFKRLF